jgi:hypothetical protein
MEAAQATRFTRWDNTGESIEYKDSYGHILAYIDYLEDGKAEVDVFDPASNRSRHHYGSRPIVNAEAIVEKHLTKLGYTK